MRDRAVQPLRGEERLAARHQRRQHKQPSGKLVSPFVMLGRFRSMSIGGTYESFYIPLAGTLTKVCIKARAWPFHKGDSFVWELKIIGTEDTQSKILTMQQANQVFDLTKNVVEPSVVELTLVRVETEDESIEVAPQALGCWVSMVFLPNPHECRTLGGHDESVA